MNATLRRSFLHRSFAAGGAFLALATFAPAFVCAADTLTWEEKEQFLLKAKPVGGAKEAKKGVTGTSRLTLTDGKITHDASVQTIDEFHPGLYLGETNFKDTYKFNIAAWKLARMLGIDDMVPPSVKRSFGGKDASYTWWIDDVMFDETERQAKKLQSPNADAWKEEYHIVNAFDQLIFNTDRNKTNLLIDKQWQIWMIDHGRAFRLQKTPKDPSILGEIDRNILAKMKALDKDAVKKEMGAYLSGGEIDGLMARRDVIVKFFEAKGESALFTRPVRK